MMFHCRLSKHLQFPLESDRLLSCKNMPKKLDDVRHNLSYQPGNISPLA